MNQLFDACVTDYRKLQGDFQQGKHRITHLAQTISDDLERSVSVHQRVSLLKQLSPLISEIDRALPLLTSLHDSLSSSSSSSSSLSSSSPSLSAPEAGSNQDRDRDRDRERDRAPERDTHEPKQEQQLSQIHEDNDDAGAADADAAGSPSLPPPSPLLSAEGQAQDAPRDDAAGIGDHEISRKEESRFDHSVGRFDAADGKDTHSTQEGDRGAQDSEEDEEEQEDEDSRNDGGVLSVDGANDDNDDVSEPRDDEIGLSSSPLAGRNAADAGEDAGDDVADDERAQAEVIAPSIDADAP